MIYTKKLGKKWKTINFYFIYNILLIIFIILLIIEKIKYNIKKKKLEKFMLIRKIVINILQEQEIKKITRKKEERSIEDSLRALKCVYKGWDFFESLLWVLVFSCTNKGKLGFNLMDLSFFCMITCKGKWTTSFQA